MWPAEGGWRPRENGRKRMMSGGLGEPKPWGGRSFVRDRFRFRFRVFFCIFLMFQNCSLLSVLRTSIYRQKYYQVFKLGLSTSVFL